MSLLAAPSITPRKQKPVSIYAGDIPTVLYSDPALGGDGKTRFNPDKLLAKWRWISATFQNQIPATVNAGRQEVFDLSIKPSSGNDEGDFEAIAIMSRGSNTTLRFALQPYVNTPTCNRQLSNIPIPSSLITGISQLPGVLRMGVYCLPDTSWQFTVQNLSTTLNNNISIVLFGRQFHGCSPCISEKNRRRAMHLQWLHPYWIGPKDPTDQRYTGPEITLGPGVSQEITFPVPSSADFLMFGMLDDSSSSGGGEPSLYAQVRHNDTQRGLVDIGPINQTANSSAQGISWRDFLAIPTVTVTGFPQSSVRAYSLAPNMGGFTHLVPRNTQVVIRFTNAHASDTVTLRPALFGLLVYGEQPKGRQTSIDGAANRERIAQGDEFLRRMGLTTGFGTGVAR